MALALAFIQAVHKWEKGSHRNLKLLKFHIQSMVKYMNKLTDQVEFLSLEAPAAQWADRLLVAGYDIGHEAERLAEFYESTTV